MYSISSQLNIRKKLKNIMANSDNVKFDIFGGTNEQQNETRRIIEELSEDEVAEKAREYLIEPTEKEKEMVDWVEKSIEEIAKKYGGKHDQFPLKRIYFVKPGSFRQIFKGTKQENAEGGVIFWLRNEIMIEKSENPVALVMSVAHELLHAKSYKSVGIFEEKSGFDFKTSRDGLHIGGHENQGEDHFEDIDEAIIEELLVDFYSDNVRKNPSFKEQISLADKIRPWFRKSVEFFGGSESDQEFSERRVYAFPLKEGKELLDVLGGDLPEASKLGFFVHTVEELAGSSGKLSFAGRGREVYAFNKILDNILENSGDRFKTRNDVFIEFAKAKFSGNILPLARTIESALGKGSFRKLDEQMQDEENNFLRNAEDLKRWEKGN